MKTLTVDELRQRMESGPVAVFDVRGDTDYEKGHIPGAKTAPLGSLTFRVASLMNPGSFVVVYSGGGDCDLSAQAATRLAGLRMTNVHRLIDGFKGWQDAGLKVVESIQAKSSGGGEVVDCRPIVVDRKQAYGGVFNNKPPDGEAAGG